MLSGKKREFFEQALTLGALLSVPFLLNACSGNILNGEKLSLFKAPDAKAAAAPPPAPAKPLPPGGSGGHLGGTPAACVPTANGSIGPEDVDLKPLAVAIEKIETPDPSQPSQHISRSQLREQIKAFAAHELELSGAELKDLVENKILSRSNTTAAPVVLPSPTPVAASTPALSKVVAQEVPNIDTAISPPARDAGNAAYVLHPSIVAFVALEQAVVFANDAGNKFNFKNKQEVKEFVYFLLNFQQPDVALAAFIKAFRFANTQVLEVAGEVARKRIMTQIQKPNGVPRLLGMVDIYFSDKDDYHYEPKESLKDAECAACFDPSADTDPTGCIAPAPAPTPTSTAAPLTKPVVPGVKSVGGLPGH